MQKNDNSVYSKAEAHMEKFKGKTFVVKYGGSILNDEEAKQAFIEDIIFMKNLGINIVIVHGGGPEINKWLKKTGIESKFEKGLRVTDEATMEIVEMVLSGHVNKLLSSTLSRLGVNAIGISGRDGNLIEAEKKYLVEKDGTKTDIGFVGEIININANILESLLKENLLPVVSPVAADKEGNAYNINADIAASFISAALKSEKLIVLTDVEGVYKDFEDKSTLIPSLTVNEIKKYIEEGIFNGGMIPKMECCMQAIERGTKNVHLIDGRKKHSLIIDVIYGSGTSIIGEI